MRTPSRLASLATAATMLLLPAVARPADAPAADSSASSPTLYASKMLLDAPSMDGAKVQADDQLKLYCNDGFEPVKQNVEWELPARVGQCKDVRIQAEQGTKINVVFVLPPVPDPDPKHKDTHGDPIMTCPPNDDQDVALGVKEVSRKTAFALEATAIVSAFAAHEANGAGGAKALVHAPHLDQPLLACYIKRTYVLTMPRATADLTAVVGANAADALRAGNADDKDKAARELITGPTEHWFISGDAIVRGVKEIKYDSTAKTVVERDKPEQFYIGINWQWGDVLAREKAFSTNRLVGKVMFLPAKHPFDSVGVGLGYRFVDGVFSAQDGVSGGLVLFGGHFWSKNDKVDATTGAVTQSGRSQSWRVGLSYDVSTLLGWLK